MPRTSEDARAYILNRKSLPEDDLEIVRTSGAAVLSQLCL
jgi:hypothetical protein